MIATELQSANSGGVALSFLESLGFQVELVRRHRPNVIGFELVTGGRCHHVFGVYFPPSDSELNTLTFLSQALTQAPARADLVVLGDVNVDFHLPWNEWQAEISLELQSWDLATAPSRPLQTATWLWHASNLETKPWRTGYCQVQMQLHFGTVSKFFTKVGIRNP